MKNKLFKNYSYEFDKNERKVISSFCKQAIQQLQNQEQSFSEINSFTSILNKISSSEDVVKLTKDESRKLSLQLEENVKHIEKQMKKSWFLKRWLLNTIYKQYNSILDEHFSN